MSTRRLVVTGLGATVVAMAATMGIAAVTRLAGIDLEVGGEEIPLSGVAVMTGFFSGVGVALAVALHRWSGCPAEWFVRSTVALTAISLLPPFLVDAATSTAVGLTALHLVAAAVMIPALVRSLGRQADRQSTGALLAG